MPTKSAQQAEQAVRDYLNWLNQGAESSEEYAKLQAELEATEDPLAKVEVMQQLIDLRDGTALAEGFKKYAKFWAEKKGINAKAFAELGVPDRLIIDAGFPFFARVTEDEKPKAKARNNVSREEVDRIIREQPQGQKLTISSTAKLTGASKQTVRSVLESLVGDVVAAAVDDPEHSGKGRAPKVFEKL